MLNWVITFESPLTRFKIFNTFSLIKKISERIIKKTIKNLKVKGMSMMDIRCYILNINDLLQLYVVRKTLQTHSKCFTILNG